MQRTARYAKNPHSQRSTTSYETLFCHPTLTTQQSNQEGIKIEPKNEMTQFRQHLMQTAKYFQQGKEYRFSV